MVMVEVAMSANLCFCLIFFATVGLGLGGCSQSHVQILPPGGMATPDPSLADSLAFAEELDGFHSLSFEERASRQSHAADAMSGWRQFEEMAAKRLDRRERPFLYEGLPPDRRGLLTGLARAMDHLEGASELDPSDVVAWAALGHLYLEIGALDTARGCLKRANWAASSLAGTKGAVDPDLLLGIHRDLCWVLRDLGLWEEGLAAVQEGLEHQPHDQDLLLIKGLLLAGAGRIHEALALAEEMPPRKIRDISNPYGTGLFVRPSDYASQWIRSQAFLAEGDIEMAFHVFGELRRPDERLSIFSGNLDSKAGKSRLPHQRRFWNDVGLIAELRDDPGALDYYVAGFRGCEYQGYYPTAADARGPLVLDVPDSRAPFFVSFGHRHYLLGSRFGYVAYQMNAMSLALFSEQARHAAYEALAVLDVLERYHVRTDICRALRGRIYYRLERFEEAWPELKSARDSFAMKNLADARTSMLLGMIELRDQRFSEACGYLEESLREDSNSPVTWRMLGVVYANLDRVDEAVAAMDRAVALEPRSLVGHFNRGLLNLQLHRCSQALPDFEIAWRLDPGNEDVQRLLQVTTSCIQAEDGEPRLPPDQDPAESVVRVEGAEVPRFEANPSLLLDHLSAELEVFFTPPDSLRAILAARTARLDSALTVNPGEVQLRKTAALAWLDLGEPAQARDLLAPWWGTGLSPLEEVMLLWADTALADNSRIGGLTEKGLNDDLATSNPYVWLLIIREIRRDPQVWGPYAEERALAHWFDHMNEFNGNSVRYWAEILRQELAAARQVNLDI